MPSQRKSKRRGQPYRPLDMQRLTSVPRVVTRGGREYHVQRLTGGDAQKSYVCPGCGHAVAAHTPHIVAWPLSAPFGVDTGVAARRHWHTYCWESGTTGGF